MFSLHNTAPEQLEAVASCHRICFASSLGTQLGHAYSKRSLEWFLAGDNRFLFHVTANDKVIGYCGGFQSKSIGEGSTSGMMQFAMKEAVIGMIKKPWLFFNKEIRPFYPLIIKNVFRKLVASKKNASATNSTKPVIRTGLVVIGVHPDYRGQGCFELLMQHFDEVCKERGAQQVGLSVRTANKRAIAAYKKMGWHISADHGKSVEMCKILSA